jgi:hypothetical protein
LIVFFNKLNDNFYTLINGDVKLNSLNKPNDRFVVQHSLMNHFYSNASFINSSILSSNEGNSLLQMFNNLIVVKLIYRASRDGFQASSFHSKCDNISNTVTIIKTTSNSVFGGFTSAIWTSNGGITYDANAFIFSLRRSGNLNKERFNVSNSFYAISSYYYYGPIFGDSWYSDIQVSSNSNQNYDSYSYFGRWYQLPKNISYGSFEAQSYLAGSNYWKTEEIEVYQVNSFESYSLTFLHNGCIYYFISKNYFFIIISYKAVYNNNTNLVKFLIRIGVNLNVQDKYGLTPLHYGNYLIKKFFERI